MNATHAPALVALSVLIAICASYTALTLAGRVAVARGRGRLAWLLGGSIAMGSGIWSMHFVAMLAFHLPVAISYDVPLVALSYLAAVAASAFALFVASRASVGPIRLAGAGGCLGLAVVTMHYTGMAAVRVPAELHYDPLLVGASVVIAITASTVALLLFLWLRNNNTPRGRVLRVGAAVVMGLAIAGMHYTAMAAANFSAATMPMPTNGSTIIGANGLAVPVIMGAFIILTLTVMGSLADQWVRMKLATAEALTESEERYRSVVSEIDEVIFRTDASPHWTFLNPAWTQITGYTVDESIGRSVHDFVHPDDRKSALESCQPLATGGADYCRHEVRYRTKTNGERWVEVHARATRGAKGELIGTAGVIRDVTERRQVEEALRTAREAAEAASRAKSEFLSRMSHELRTPLNAILGFGQLVELDANTPGLRESGDQILRAGRHLLALINEVLDITRIEAGGIHLSTEAVAVEDVVTEVTELIAPLGAAHGITVIVNRESIGDLYVHADRQRLKQVLLNLAANAVKYNRRDGSVTIACANAASSGRLRIMVRDTGIGIAAAQIGRLFTPFDRLGAEQLGIEGTGLGLALSRRLAQAMDSDIGVESEPGVGSTFWVEIPRDVSPLSRLDVTTSRATPIRGVSMHAVSRRILYVEDNLSNLTLVQRLLARRDDIELIPAMQGGFALELARMHRPDLVLLDLHLPDMSGEEVLAQLRQSTDCRDIPVVVLSADATQGQIDRLLASGVDAYLTKPLDVKQFMSLVESVLARRRAA